MHELSLCQALLAQVEQLATTHDATQVTRIHLIIGPLAGVEAALLQHAYPLVASGSRAEGAELVIKTAPIRVLCFACGAETAAEINRLGCGKCGSAVTRVVSGAELLLAQVEMLTI
jgi:hydrogenase nickel incorporation protein HypA/HybF